MLSATDIKEYASQPVEVILSSQKTCKDLTYACLSHVMVGQARQALALFNEILKHHSFTDFHTCMRIALQGRQIDIKAQQVLGRIIRTSLSELRSSTSKAQDQDIKNDDFIYVIGTSNARGFGSSLSFFSIFAYVGWQTFVLSNEKFEDCLRRTIQIIQRLAEGKPILLILGSEPRLLLENRFKLRKQEFGELEDSDFKYMEQAARKYKELGLKIKEHARGPLNFLVPMPTFNEDINTLSLHMIKHLNQELEGTDIGLIDPFESFLDPETGIFDDKLQITRDEDELHFNHEGLKRIMSVLVSKGVLSETVLSEPQYHWDNLILLNLGNDNEVRIWNDPAKSMKSGMTAATIAAGHLLDYVTGYYSQHEPKVLCILNAHQGFIPLGIPSEISERILSVSFDERDVCSSKRLFHFSGRSDIQAISYKDLMLKPEDANDIQALVVYIHPDDSIKKIKQHLHNLANQYNLEDILLFCTSSQKDKIQKELNGKVYFQCSFENRHLAEGWKAYKLLHLKQQKKEGSC